MENYYRTELKEAVRLMRLQSERLLYSMDSQLKVQAEVRAFLKRHQ